MAAPIAKEKHWMIIITSLHKTVQLKFRQQKILFK